MHLLNGTLSRTTRVSRYQKGKTNVDFTETRDSEWQWHQLGHMQVCISLQTDNHASTPPLETFDMTIRHNGRPKRMELEFSRWIYFHLRSKIFFWPSYGKRGEGDNRPHHPSPQWIHHRSCMKPTMLCLNKVSPRRRHETIFPPSVSATSSGRTTTSTSGFHFQNVVSN